jgi:hypothetical protein
VTPQTECWSLLMERRGKRKVRKRKQSPQTGPAKRRVSTGPCAADWLCVERLDAGERVQRGDRKGGAHPKVISIAHAHGRARWLRRRSSSSVRACPASPASHANSCSHSSRPRGRLAACLRPGRAQQRSAAVVQAAEVRFALAARPPADARAASPAPARSSAPTAACWRSGTPKARAEPHSPSQAPG